MIPDVLKRNMLKASAGGALAIAAVLVGHFEGRLHVPYRDPAGVLTVCEGHTGPDIIPGKQYTAAECDQFKAQDLAEAEAAVDRLVKVDISKWQKAALIDFAINKGAGALGISTLLRLTNAGEQDATCMEYRRWVYAGGRRLQGLANAPMRMNGYAENFDEACVPDRVRRGAGAGPAVRGLVAAPQRVCPKGARTSTRPRWWPNKRHRPLCNRRKTLPMQITAAPFWRGRLRKLSILLPLLVLTGCCGNIATAPKLPEPAADLMAPVPTGSEYLESVSADLSKWEKTLQDSLTK
jgi:lysozyme